MDTYLDNKMEDLALDRIPPVIGCLISDKNGKSIATFEICNNAIKQFLHKDKDNENGDPFELDLIPMFTSALKLFSEALNVQDLPRIEINGSNIKLHIMFYFEKFTVTFFLNPNTDFERLENPIEDYLTNLFEEFKYDLCDVNKISSKEFINSLEKIGWHWLLELNNNYISSQ
jgi:hypothetical protein